MLLDAHAGNRARDHQLLDLAGALEDRVDLLSLQIDRSIQRSDCHDHSIRLRNHERLEECLGFVLLGMYDIDPISQQEATNNVRFLNCVWLILPHYPISSELVQQDAKKISSLQVVIIHNHSTPKPVICRFFDDLSRVRTAKQTTKQFEVTSKLHPKAPVHQVNSNFIPVGARFVASVLF